LAQPTSNMPSLQESPINTFQIRFWGTRGSLPVSGPHVVVFGGNTSCVQVETQEKDIFIFDGGTGLREFGAQLNHSDEPKTFHLFFTHFHWDHFLGLPFFTPVFNAQNTFHIYGPLPGQRPLQKILSDAMNSIYFPVPLREFPAKLEYHPLSEKAIDIGSIQIVSTTLCHPGATIGYRMESRGKSICYITDNELGLHPLMDKLLETFCQGTDVLIHDAQFTPQEYVTRKGWGHSTHEAVIGLAKVAQVKKVVFFHHDVARKDDDLREIVARFQKELEQEKTGIQCMAAAEGEIINI